VTNRSLKAGIIGCGRIAGDFEDDPTWLRKPCTHAGVLSSIEEVEISAVCDNDYDKARSFADKWNVPAFYQNVVDFLEHGYFDVVSICTPPSTHCDITTLVAKKQPKLIFSEKPLATSYIDGEKMVQCCKEAGCHLVVNHNKRWNSVVEKAKELIANGVIGCPLAIVCRYTSGLEIVGTHLVDLILNFVDESLPINLFSLKEKTKTRKLWYSENYSQLDPAFSGMVLFDNGIIGVLIGSCLKDYPHFSIEIDGTHGQIQLLNNCMELYVGQAKSNSMFGGAKRLHFEQVNIKEEESEMMQAMKENITLCKGKIKESSSSGENALKVIDLIERLRKKGISFEYGKV